MDSCQEIKVQSNYKAMHQWFMALENLTDKELIFMARLEFLKGFILIEKLRGLWNFSFPFH